MKPIRIKKNMPAEKYRKAKGISKSALDTFAVCPAKYKAERDGLIHRQESTAMAFGTLLHSLVLDGKANFHIKPDGMSFASKEGKAWRDEHADKPIVSQSDADEVNRAASAILKHRHASQLFGVGSSEVSMFGVHEETGLAIKGRADWLGARHIADIKTTRDASNKGIASSIVSFRYHVQAAHYLLLAQQNGLDVQDFYFIFIERGDVPLINVRLLAQAAIDAGRMELDNQLRELKQCRDTGIWPDYSGTTDKPQLIDLPPWYYSDTTGAELIEFDDEPQTTSNDIIP